MQKSRLCWFRKCIVVKKKKRPSLIRPVLQQCFSNVSQSIQFSFVFPILFLIFFPFFVSTGGRPPPALLHLPLCCPHHWCLRSQVSGVSSVMLVGGFYCTLIDVQSCQVKSARHYAFDTLAWQMSTNTNL